MSSVDLSDPHISKAYDALLRNDPLRWLLLAYGNRPNVLVLCASGTGDVDELRTHLMEHVCYGIFREQTQNHSFHVSLTYIPDSVKGVWRARALVHGNAVSSQFKVHQVLNVSNPDQVTVQALRSILRLPPRVPQVSSSFPLSPLLGGDHPSILSIPRKPVAEIRAVLSPSTRTRSPSPMNHTPSRSSSLQLASSLSTEKHSPSAAIDMPSVFTGNGSSPSINPTSATRATSPPPLAEISTSVSSKLLTKLSLTQSPLIDSPISIQSSNGTQAARSPASPQHASWLVKQDFPLPPPPSSEINDELQDAERESDNSTGQPGSPHIGSIPDSNSVASLHTSDRAPSPPSIFPHSANNPMRRAERSPDRAIDGLPTPSLSLPLTAFQEISDHSVMSTEDPTRLSALNKVHSKFQERAASPEHVEEERKLVGLEEERRRRAAERARREKQEREEEEAREREFEERKKREKKRRLESARRAEEQRAEQKRQQEEEEARQRAEKERKEADIRQRRNHIKQRFEKQAGVDLLSGFITLESSSSWKRRYYRLSTEDWIFFKSDKDTTMPIHAVELSRVRALREWHEGYDELEAIPNSFAVELKDDAPCLFFADSAEDKEILLGLLNQAAGL